MSVTVRSLSLANERFDGAIKVFNRLRRRPSRHVNNRTPKILDMEVSML